MKSPNKTKETNIWYFIASENSFAVALANSPEEAIKELPGDKKIKTAYPLNGFRLYEAFLAHDRQFHTDTPDMSEQEDRFSFYTFCAGYFLETPNSILGKIQWQSDFH